MKVLLVEPQYRRLYGANHLVHAQTQTSPCERKKTHADDTLWYPPLGLMKLARFHKERGDEVAFVSGCNPEMGHQADLLCRGASWDRIYITTLFTFSWPTVVATIKFYKQAIGGTVGKIFVGGVMASLMPEDLFEETGVYPITGVLSSPSSIGLKGNENIDQLPPDYGILDPDLYAINQTYYAYTSRGCVNSCAWCGVPKIEPVYMPYIDIKPAIRKLRKEWGDKPRLNLMDNNVLASKQFERIVMDLEELGYGRDQYTDTRPPKQRVVDFNQGLDASFLDEKRMKLIARLNVKPMRIAFDRVAEEKEYVRAVRLAHEFGVREFSNYMLYNWKDSPRDLYDRLAVNIRLNEEWQTDTAKVHRSAIYSYPMRFAPINSDGDAHANRQRDLFWEHKEVDWFKDAAWTKRFVRNMEIMKGAAHGSISPTPSLAWRTIGKTYEEFLTNLYMPEELLRNRNKHEKRVYEDEPQRSRGTGKVEQFRSFVLGLLKKGDKRFRVFHDIVCSNSVERIRRAMQECDDKEILEWLQWYLKK